MSASVPPSLDLASMRRRYTQAGLREEELQDSWVELLARWITEAGQAGICEPNAMVLASADQRQGPSIRTVLLKGLDARGLIFFTHYSSRKGRELRAWPRAAACFSWPALERQVTVHGAVVRVPPEDSDAYWHQRPYESQIGSAASPQSQPLADRAELEARAEELAASYPQQVPRPADWGGLRLQPETVEFWQGRPGRLHDRLQLHHTPQGWQLQRLAP